MSHVITEGLMNNNICTFKENSEMITITISNLTVINYVL